MAGFRRTLFQVGLFLALLFAAPQVLANDYYVSVLIFCCLNSVIVAGLTLLMGYAGQISLGHAAFYGLGAYSTAVASSVYGLPMELTFFIAIAVAALVAVVVGIPALKLHGNYLAMATLGFGIIVYIFFNETVNLTGGPTGFRMVGTIPKLKLFGYTFKSDQSAYYLLAGILGLVMLCSLNVINSRFGRALRAIHTSEKAAMVGGVNIAKYKLFVFVLSAVFAAVAGFFYAHWGRHVAPPAFGFLHSVKLLTMVVLGGMTNIWGAVVGAFFLTLLPQFLHDVERFETLIFGGILIAFMMFLPDGIVGGVERAARALFRKRAREDSDG